MCPCVGRFSPLGIGTVEGVPWGKTPYGMAPELNVASTLLVYKGRKNIANTTLLDPSDLKSHK